MKSSWHTCLYHLTGCYLSRPGMGVTQPIDLVPVSLTVFPSQFKFMEISFHSHLNSYTWIAKKFCTWHDSCTVVACAKICCDLIVSNGITVRQSFHLIWIVGKKSLVKRAPVPQVPQCTSPVSHNATLYKFLFEYGALCDTCLMHCGMCDMGLHTWPTISQFFKIFKILVTYWRQCFYLIISMFFWSISLST